MNFLQLLLCTLLFVVTRLASNGAPQVLSGRRRTLLDNGDESVGDELHLSSRSDIEGDSMLRNLAGASPAKSVVKKVLQLAVLKLDRQPHKAAEPHYHTGQTYDFTTAAVRYAPDNRDAYVVYGPKGRLNPKYVAHNEQAKQVNTQPRRKKGRKQRMKEEKEQLEALVLATSKLQKEIHRQYGIQMELKQELQRAKNEHYLRKSGHLATGHLDTGHLDRVIIT